LKLLIIGSEGNLGSHLQEACRCAGYTVVCASRANIGDIDKLLRGCNAVVHAAGDVKNSIADKVVDFTESNIMLTAKALEACDKQGVSHFFYVSSCAVYGDASATSELKSCQPINLNGKFKKLNEELVLTFCKKRGITPTIFRLFNLYGGHDRFSVVSNLKRCLEFNERFTLLNDGNSRRDFIHVQDAAEIISKCLTFGKLPPVINLGTGQTTSVKEILDVFLKLHPTISIEQRKMEEVEYSRADITILRGLLGNYHFRSVLNDVANLLV